MHEPLIFKLDQNPKGPGLRCDDSGLFLGRDALLQRDRLGNFEARPVAELQQVFGRTYGGETNWESRVRSVKLVADALNKGAMARAMMTAVLMRLPDPAGRIRIADVDGVLAKTFNPDEPRDERGRWTSGGSDDPISDVGHRSARMQLADAGLSDAFNDPVAQAAARTADADSADRAIFGRDDDPTLVLAAAEGENGEESRSGPGGNDAATEELIPQRLQRSPGGLAVELLDNLVGISGPGDEANLAWAEIQKSALLQAIRKIDPNYVFQSIVPDGGLAAMSWEGRLNLINGLRADLAAVIYRKKGDIGPLQEVTFDFMQRATNAAYDDAVQRYDAGRLNVRLSREEAIGNYVDNAVRIQLGLFFDSLGISTDSESPIRVNRRAYDSSSPDLSYRIPDVRVGDFAFDISLTAKSSSVPQIRGFFSADFKPIGVVIIRPNQLGNNSSYVIWRRKGD